MNWLSLSLGVSALLALAITSHARGDEQANSTPKVAIALSGKTGGSIDFLPLGWKGAPADAFPSFTANPEKSPPIGGETRSLLGDRVEYICRTACKVVVSGSRMAVRIRYSIYWGDTKKIDRVVRTIPVWTETINNGPSDKVPDKAKRITVDRDLEAYAYLVYAN
jgi:hypothetical protein